MDDAREPSAAFPGRWLDTADAAKYTGYSIDRLRRLCKSGCLKYARIDHGRYRFKREWLDALFDVTSPQNE